MHQYTHGNHFSWSYTLAALGENELSLRGGPADQFQVNLKARAASVPPNYRDACLYAARLIHNDARKQGLKLNLSLSGGIDSESMMLSFLQQDIPFDISIMRFTNNLNEHDYTLAVQAADRAGVPYKTIELDIRKFFDGPVMDYAIPVQCCASDISTYMWLFDQLDGYPVFGAGDTYIKKTVPNGYIPGKYPYYPSEWFLSEREHVLGLQRHVLTTGRPGVVGFHHYLPEQILTFALHPATFQLCTNQQYGKLSTITSKPIIYDSFEGMPARPKHTGFELVYKTRDRLNRELGEMMPHAFNEWGMPYFDLIQNLMPKTEIFS